MAAILAGIILALVYILNKKSGIDQAAIRTFECGFNTLTSRSIPFSSRFYLTAIIFLVFDLEIIILIPFFFSSLRILNFTGAVAGTLFIVILITGLAYEWNQKILEWKK